MQRNTLTTAEKLEVGDRFYLASTSTKRVHQMIAPKTEPTGLNNKEYFSCPADCLGTKREKDYTQPIKKDTRVIFLRSGANG